MQSMFALHLCFPIQLWGRQQPTYSVVKMVQKVTKIIIQVSLIYYIAHFTHSSQNPQNLLTDTFELHLIWIILWQGRIQCFKYKVKI